MRVHQGAARITSIDGSIRLYETFDAIGTQGASLGRNNACRYGAGEVKRVAYCQNPLTQLQVVRVANLDGRQVFGVNLHERKVGGLVRTNDAALEFATIVKFYGNLVSLSHYVIIRHDVAILRDDDTRTSSVAVGLLILALLRLLTTLAKAKEVSKEILKWILHLHTLRLAFDSDADVDDTVDCCFSSTSQVHIRRWGSNAGRRWLGFGHLSILVVDHSSGHDTTAQDKGNNANPSFRCLVHFVPVFID